MNNIRENPPLQTVITWAVITVIAIFGIFAPSLFGIDGFKGGFAISALCIFLMIIGIIVMAIYSGRARLLNRILSGEDILAHWTYTSEEWARYAKKEYAAEKSEKKILFYIIAGIALFAGIVFLLIDHKNGIWVLVAMVALVAVIAFTAWFTAWYNYRQNKKYLGQAYITPKAVYLNRQLHTWHGPGDKLESAEFIENKAQSMLALTYSAITRTGRERHNIRIPVPQGKEKEAETIVPQLKK